MNCHFHSVIRDHRAHGITLKLNCVQLLYFSFFCFLFLIDENRIVCEKSAASRVCAEIVLDRYQPALNESGQLNS